MARSARRTASPHCLSICVLVLCAGGSSARLATSARRACCRHAAGSALNRVVLSFVYFRRWLGAPRYVARCGGNLDCQSHAGRFWADTAASHGTTARRQQLAIRIRTLAEL